MVKARKKPSRTGQSSMGSPGEEALISREEEEIRAMNRSKNRKNKKAGDWQALGLDHPVYRGIRHSRNGYRHPTEIQRKAIPPILDGKDVVGMSRTGSGKTAAFVIPMLQKLKKRDTRGARALILSPTRELALQTFKVVKELGRFTGMRCACLVGGDSIDDQFAALHENPDILLATPGRLLHVVIEMDLKLSSIQYLVFDEADRLFEMGFADQLHEILKRIPESKQVLLFSATLPKVLVDFAKAGLSDPTLVRLNLESKLSKNLKVVFGTCRQTEKIPALISLCRMAEQRDEKTIVFCATMKHVEYIVSILKEAGVQCTFLYSQLDPAARKENIARFRNNECAILVVTDIAARGVDIPLLDTAINLHFPPKPKLFVHRVGRVARAGKSGTSISLITPDEIPYLADLFLFLGKPMVFVSDDGVDSETSDVLIGRFPENVAHQETEFLVDAHNVSLEISDLRTKSENAMQKFKKTAPQPSAESIRRTKREFRSITPGVHPYFAQMMMEGESGVTQMSASDTIASKSILDQLKSWRPSATIFEIHSSAKEEAASVMKAKRLQHQALIEHKRHGPTLGGEEEAHGVTATEQEVEVSGQLATVVPAFGKGNEVGGSAKRRKVRETGEEKRRRERDENYIAYRPRDQQSESALAVEKNVFDEMARQVSVDIIADDEKGLYVTKKRKHWDRKLKKFVGPNEESRKMKRIRTEEGTWLPATYKSGRYATWQKKRKMDYQRNQPTEEDGADPNAMGRQHVDVGRRIGRGSASTHHGRQEQKALKTKKSVGRGPSTRNELRNSDQIRKIRREKARRQTREQQRTEKRSNKRENRRGK